MINFIYIQTLMNKSNITANGGGTRSRKSSSMIGSPIGSPGNSSPRRPSDGDANRTPRLKRIFKYVYIYELLYILKK